MPRRPSLAQVIDRSATPPKRMDYQPQQVSATVDWLPESASIASNRRVIGIAIAYRSLHVSSTVRSRTTTRSTHREPFRESGEINRARLKTVRALQFEP